jgi:hypothetical protein
VCAAAASFTALVAHPTLAEEPDVPARVQAALLAKVVAYDRSFEAHAAEPALVLIVERRGDADSRRTAAALVSELGRQARLGARKHREELVHYTTPEALANICRARRAAIVYITPGFESEVVRIAAALDGVDVLSVSAVARYVEHGIVLGFGVLSGKPKIVVHQARAKRQHVAFRADLLQLARVIP